MTLIAALVLIDRNPSPHHITAAEMLMLAAHRCPDAESTALVRGVLLRSGYRPKKAERLGRAAHLSEMHAFCAMSILLRTGQVRVRVRVRVRVKVRVRVRASARVRVRVRA